MTFRKYVELTDPATIRALAHPARAAILHHLHQDGPATATEVSKLVGVSPSGCSYHLRTLAKLGFVEEEKGQDRRERRWRLLVGGYGIPKEAQDSPEVLAAARLWGHQWVRNHENAIHNYLEAEEWVPAVWQKATTMYAATLHLTPDEVLEIGNRYLSLVDEYAERELTGEKPDGAPRVELAFTAVPWPEDLGIGSSEGKHKTRARKPATSRSGAKRADSRKGRSKR